MVIKAFMRANIPFVFNTDLLFSENFINNALNNNWEKFEMNGDFLLKHINLSFANNVTALLKKCNKTINVPVKNFKENTISNYDITIDEVQVYCFDTGIGFCTLHIPYDTEIDKTVITDICSVLYNSVTGSPLKIVDNGVSKCFDCVGDSFLKEIFVDNSYKLFGTANNKASKRINMFSCALLKCDETPENDCAAYDKYCFQLANTYDNRDVNFNVRENDLYHQHSYNRWGFSTRGCAAVANLTGKKTTDDFLMERWFYSNKTNYFYLYLMVLHEKFATYNYLNIIADDPEMKHFEMNQKLLMDFNFKYIFKIVSDEQFIQDVFLKFKMATNADDAYIELSEQLKKMFDNAEFNSNKSIENKNQSLNLISIIISIVCSLSVIFDTMSLFFSQGFSLNFNTTKNALFCGGVILEIIIFVLVIVSVFLINKSKKK